MTVTRPSPFASSIGPTRKARASAAPSSAPLPSPEPTPSPPTAPAPTAMASPSKPPSPPATSTSTALATPIASAKTSLLYAELHIEQGPVLERLGLPLAAVLGTKGVERHAITFHGQEAHSGSTPMADRRDALAAAAKLALEIRAIASKRPDRQSAPMGSSRTPSSASSPPWSVAASAPSISAIYRPQSSRRCSRKLKPPAAASPKKNVSTVDRSCIWSIEPILFQPTISSASARNRSKMILPALSSSFPPARSTMRPKSPASASQPS